jgi:hypothetical protein
MTFSQKNLCQGTQVFLYLGFSDACQLGFQLFGAKTGFVGESTDLVLSSGQVLDGAVEILEHHCQVLESGLQRGQIFGVFRIGLLNIQKK